MMDYRNPAHIQAELFNINERLNELSGKRSDKQTKEAPTAFEQDTKQGMEVLTASFSSIDNRITNLERSYGEIGDWTGRVDSRLNEIERILQSLQQPDTETISTNTEENLEIVKEDLGKKKRGTDAGE